MIQGCCSEGIVQLDLDLAPKDMQPIRSAG